MGKIIQRLCQLLGKLGLVPQQSVFYICGHDVLPPPLSREREAELLERIEAIVSKLTERQQRILRLHFGMEDGKCHSLEEIGNLLGISKERARQIEQQAMRKLRSLGKDMGLEDFLE